jgi:hypothetical protein
MLQAHPWKKNADQRDDNPTPTTVSTTPPNGLKPSSKTQTEIGKAEAFWCFRGTALETPENCSEQIMEHNADTRGKAKHTAHLPKDKPSTSNSAATTIYTDPVKRRSSLKKKHVDTRVPKPLYHCARINAFDSLSLADLSDQLVVAHDVSPADLFEQHGDPTGGCGTPPHVVVRVCDKTPALAASLWLMFVTGVSTLFMTLPVTAFMRCTGFVAFLSALMTCNILLTSTTSSSDT